MHHANREKWYVIFFFKRRQCKYKKDVQKWQSQWKAWNCPVTVGQEMEVG